MFKQRGKPLLASSICAPAQSVDRFLAGTDRSSILASMAAHLRRPFSVRALFTFLISAAMADVYAVDPVACTEGDLRNRVREYPKEEHAQERRAALLASALSCPNVSDYLAAAGEAAYELALFYSGATRHSSVDMVQAIAYAEKSVDMLSRTPNKKAWFNVGLASVQLRLRAAQTLTELAQAQEALERLLPQLPDAPWVDDARLEYYSLLADINESANQLGEPAARSRAIGAIDRFLELDAKRRLTTERPNALERKARLLAAPNRTGGSGANDLPAAASLFEKASDLYRTLGDTAARTRAQINLAVAYVHVEDRNFGQNIERAIRLLESILPGVNPRADRDTYCDAANTLASAYMARQQGSRDSNMLGAVRWFRSTHKLLDPNEPRDQARWVRSSMNLALALEATKISEESNLQEADDLLTKVIGWLEERKRFSDTVRPLAIQVDIRLTWAAWGVPGQLDEAGAVLAKAEGRAAHLPPAQRAGVQADKADYLRARYAEGDEKALDQAIAAYRVAISLTDAADSPSIWASLQNNLGNACNSQIRPDLYQCARDAYQQALKVRTETAMPREHVDTLVNIANLEFENANWREAADLYVSVAKRHRGMFDAIDSKDVLLHSVSQSKRWFERAAFALARDGRAEEGLWIAEQGKMRLLKRKLGLKEASTEDAGLRYHLADLAAPTGTLILFPIVTTKGGVVFSLFKSQTDWVLKSFFLDGLSADAAVTYLQGGKRARPAKGWLGAYSGVHESSAPTEGALRQWSKELRISQAWLGSTLAQPVFERLKGESISATAVVWVTQGELALLPIHTALMQDGRTLLEHMPVSYSPSLLLLKSGESGRTRAARTRPTKLLSIGNPTSDPALPLAEVEARSAAMKVPAAGVRLLLGAEATPQRLKQELRKTKILHFAGHANFDRSDPLRSHLQLANGQRLTVADLQASMGGVGPDLAILSACESGLIQVYGIANEFQGLPAAFLGMGTTGVVSSLWPVDDGPTLFLIDHLMELLLTSADTSASSALRQSQLWIKTARGQELAIVASRLANAARTKAAKDRLTKIGWLFRHRPQWQPYSDPSHWAGFFYSGKESHANGAGM